MVLVSQAQPGDPYILIDGLQRLSTLKAYISNPLEFIDENDKFINKDLLDKLFEVKYVARGLQLPSESRLEKEKRTFLKKMLSLMKAQSQMPEALDLWPELCQTLEIEEDQLWNIKKGIDVIR